VSPERDAPLEQMAYKASGVAAFLEAERVALIGASSGARDRWSYNARMTRALLASSFREVVLVTRRDREIDGRATFASLEDYPGPPGDLCVLVVPHHALAQTVAQTSAMGWPRSLIITGQLDDDDRRALAALTPDPARIWGPNCTGFMSVEANRRVMATDYNPPNRPGRPRMAVIGQSGGALGSLASVASGLGLNISHMMSTGEEVDIGIEDLLGYLARAGSTDAVAVFMEEARRPAQFLAGLDDCAAAGVVVLVVHVGRSPAGRVAALNHSGALVGDGDELEAAVASHGAVVCRSFRDAAGAAAVALAGRAGRPGRRAAFFSSSGGAAALACDLATDSRLELASLSDSTVAAMRAVTGDPAETGNPFDSANGGGTASSLPPYLAAVTADPGVDLTVFMHSGRVYEEVVAEQLAYHAAPSVRLIAVWPGVEPVVRERLLDLGVPVLDDVGDVCRWLDLALPPGDPGSAVRLEPSGPATPSDPGDWLTYWEASRLLRSTDLDTPRQVLVTDDRDLELAVDRAKDGLAVVVKAAGLRGHKGALGGVVGGVAGSERLRAVAHAMMSKLGPVVIEETAPNGLEVILAVRHGPFGGVAIAGLGGPFADSFGKQVVLGASATEQDWHRAIAASPLATVVGAADRVSDASRRLARAARALTALMSRSGLASIEINPVILSAERAMACDVKIQRLPTPRDAPERQAGPKAPRR
jgi:acetate---CoA ligase (ADP-forming)